MSRGGFNITRDTNIIIIIPLLYRFFFIDTQSISHTAQTDDDVGYKVVGLRARDSETENVCSSLARLSLLHARADILYTYICIDNRKRRMYAPTRFIAERGGLTF